MEYIFITDPIFDNLSTERLKNFCEISSLVDKTRACAALARRAHKQPDLIPYLLMLIRSSAYRQTRVMGTISIAHVVFACLWYGSTTTLQHFLREILYSWPEPDRSDLVWFLQSQDLECF